MTIYEIQKKYTRVEKIGSEHICFLTIGCQEFYIAKVESKKAANWYSKMLSIALKSMLDEAMEENIIDRD